MSNVDQAFSCYVVPLTINSAVKFDVVALFLARHVKLPTCRSVTESIVSTEFRLPILAVVMPAISPTGFPLKYQWWCLYGFQCFI